MISPESHQIGNKIPGQKRLIILFDEACRLCNNIIWFISKNDRRGLFCFIPLYSEKAKEYFRNGGNRHLNSGSLLLIEDGKFYAKSGAVLHILRRLNGMWPVLYAFIIIPAFLRDPLYDIIARYRYRWFGSCVDCNVP
jgi:predicted DCC family thiol-disulfide oxidoreductase YuxK